MGRKKQSIFERFSKSYTVSECGCWLSNSYKDKDGYCQFWVSADSKSMKAHRWSYEHYIGKIPEGLTIDHICRVKHCVNPDHLEAVTNLENISRAKKMITHCRHGHELSGNNLYIRPDGDRGCRVCRLDADKRYRKRKLENKENTK